MPVLPFVSILIVSYNAVRHLPGCLHALAEQTYPTESFEVLLLDNASNDSSAEFVGMHFPWVRLIESPRNLGFAEGNNVLTIRANGEFLVLLNPDTIADPYWLEELVRAATENPGAWIAAKLLIAAKPQILNSAGLFLTRDGRGADRGFEQLDDGRYEAGGEVFAGCGAALLIRRTTLGKVLFDPSYFLYCEDLEACWRTRKRNVNVVFAPRAVVLHAVGASSGEGSPVYLFHVERNRALTALRHADPFLAFWSALGLVARVGRAMVRAVLGKTPWPVAFAVVRALASYGCRAPGVLLARLEEAGSWGPRR